MQNPMEDTLVFLFLNTKNRNNPVFSFYVTFIRGVIPCLSGTSRIITILFLSGGFPRHMVQLLFHYK